MKEQPRYSTVAMPTGLVTLETNPEEKRLWVPGLQIKAERHVDHSMSYDIISATELGDDLEARLTDPVNFMYDASYSLCYQVSSMTAELWHSEEAGFSTDFGYARENQPDIWFQIGLCEKANCPTYPVVPLSVVGRAYCEANAIVPARQRVMLPIAPEVSFLKQKWTSDAVLSFLAEGEKQSQYMVPKDFVIQIVSFEKAEMVLPLIRELLEKLSDTQCLVFSSVEAMALPEDQKGTLWWLDMENRSHVDVGALPNPTIEIRGTCRGPEWTLIPALVTDLAEALARARITGRYIAISWSWDL